VLDWLFHKTKDLDALAAWLGEHNWCLEFFLVVDPGFETLEEAPVELYQEEVQMQEEDHFEHVTSLELQLCLLEMATKDVAWECDDDLVHASDRKEEWVDEEVEELHDHHDDRTGDLLEVEEVASCAYLQYAESSHVVEVQIEEEEVVGLDGEEVQVDLE